MAFPEYLPTTPHFLRHLADKFADRTLIVADDRRMTFGELESRSARLARALLSRGVGKGTRVGILMGNGPEWVLCWAAISRIGAIAVPFNTFFQRTELRWVLQHADIHTLISIPRFLSHDYLERLEQAIPGLAEHSTADGPLRSQDVPHLRQIIVLGDSDRAWSLDGGELEGDAGGDSRIDDAFLRAVEESVTPADVMVMMYSSGSTADPKGALHSHGAVVRHSYNLLEGRDLRAEDRIWSPMPFFWVGGFSFSLLGSMHLGACLLCQDSFDPGSTLEFLERERATVALGWPHFGKALADHPDAKRRDLSSLRAGNVPEILPSSVVPEDPELRQNALGMTETLGPHTAAGVGPLPEALRSSFGPPVQGVEHKIVDPDTGKRLAKTDFGEICVRGYSLMQGLYKIERQDTFDEDGFYHTGDGGSFSSDDILFFKGRLGDMIKTGGANVTPSEVEQVLAGFDEIKAAYVVGIPDGDRGEAVAASVVLELNRGAEPEDLRKRLKAEISAYKVPRFLYIDEDEALPFTDTGKIDKRKLSQLLAQRASAS